MSGSQYGAGRASGTLAPPAQPYRGSADYYNSRCLHLHSSRWNLVEGKQRSICYPIKLAAGPTSQSSPDAAFSSHVHLTIVRPAALVA